MDKEEVVEMYLKFEEMEDTISAQKEFMLETLVQFQNQMAANNEDRQKEIEDLAHNLSDLNSSAVMITSPTRVDFQNPGTSKMPFNTLEEMPIEWQTKLGPFLPEELDCREKLSKMQFAFIMHWIETSDTEVKGRRPEAQALRRYGIETGVWDENFLPEGCTDFEVYLFEKIRNVLRKKRRSMKKQELSDIFHNKQ